MRVCISRHFCGCGTPRRREDALMKARVLIAHASLLAFADAAHSAPANDLIPIQKEHARIRAAGFFPGCEYHNYLLNVELDDEGVPHRLDPPKKASTVTLYGLWPTRLTQAQGVDRCKQGGMKMAEFFWDYPQGSVDDFTGASTCQRLESSALAQALQTYQPTGSPILGPRARGKIVWLPLRNRGQFQGMYRSNPNAEFPRVGALVNGQPQPSRVFALFVSEGGTLCHINPPEQIVDPNWLLDVLCQPEDTYFVHDWVSPATLKLACEPTIFNPQSPAPTSTPWRYLALTVGSPSG
jgi:hypothetical protein